VSLFKTGRVSLKVEAVWSFEISESLYQSSRRHIPQEIGLHTALNCVFLSRIFFDIWGLHCDEYRVECYECCPEVLSLSTKSDPHTHTKYCRYSNLMFSYKTSFLLDTSEKNCKKRLLASSCLSVRPHWTLLFLLKGFSRSLVFRYFSKICREKSSFIKIWQDYLAKFFL
jgi:hypothetical protein